MVSNLLKRWIEHIHAEKLEDPYFFAKPKVYHSSKLNPNHCLNAKWRAFKEAMQRGRHPDIPPATRLRMHIGEIIHSEIQKFLKEEYQVEVVSNIPVLDFNIVCRADLLGKDEIIEIKTWNRKKDKLPQKPEISHLYQVNTYCFAFKKKHARLWYINYDTGTDVWFEHQADPKMYRDVIAYTTLLDYFISFDIEPPHKENCRCKIKKKEGGV